MTTEPVTLESTTRTIAVATLHSIAENLAYNVSQPMPEYAALTRHNVPLAQFTAFIALNGVKVWGAEVDNTNPGRYAEVPLATKELHGISVVLRYFLAHADSNAIHDEGFRAHNAEIDRIDTEEFE